MKLKIILYFIPVIFLLSGCFNSSDYVGYTKTDTGLHYKLIEIGDGTKKPKPGDYLQLMITYKTDKDSIFLTGLNSNPTGKVILPFNHISFEGSFEEGLTKMAEGDSMSFIVDAEPLFKEFLKVEVPFFIKKDGVVKVDVKIYKILNQQEYDKELLSYQQVMEDRDIEEQRVLKIYIDSCKTPFALLDSNIFYHNIIESNGAVVKKGDTLSIHYKGYFFNEKVFESTYERGEPLTFIYGEEGQVIRGIEKGIKLMKKGSKTKFIIPSHFAFGESGSSNGIVPPYTTVIYELEILK